MGGRNHLPMTAIYIYMCIYIFRLLSSILFLSVSLSVCLSLSLSVCLSVCLPACLSVCLSACLPTCLTVCLSDQEEKQKTENRKRKTDINPTNETNHPLTVESKQNQNNQWHPSPPTKWLCNLSTRKVSNNPASQPVSQPVRQLYSVFTRDPDR